MLGLKLGIGSTVHLTHKAPTFTEEVLLSISGHVHGIYHGIITVPERVKVECFRSEIRKSQSNPNGTTVYYFALANGDSIVLSGGWHGLGQIRYQGHGRFGFTFPKQVKVMRGELLAQTSD